MDVYQNGYVDMLTLPWTDLESRHTTILTIVIHQMFSSTSTNFIIMNMTYCSKMNFFRFARLISMTTLEHKSIWDIIRKIRYGLVIDYSSVLSTSSCITSVSSTLFSDDILALNIELIEKELDLNTTDDFNDKVSNETLEIAGEMFIYLNLCPKFMWRWINLYVDLLQNSPPDIIVQTLNRILYQAKKNNDKSVFNITKSLFIKITKKLSLDETYSKLTHKNQSKVNSFSIHTQNLKGKPSILFLFSYNIDY